MDAPTITKWLNKANKMIQEFVYELLRLTRQVIDSYGLPLNEFEFLILLSISTLTIAVIFNKIRKPRTRTYIPARGATRHAQVYPNPKSEIKPELKPMHPFFRADNKMVLEIVDGTERYSRRKGFSERELEMMAKEYTVEEAWTALRDSFWKVRRDSIKQFQPEKYAEMLYWEAHLDDYFTYMGLKLIYNEKYKDTDCWVTVGRGERRLVSTGNRSDRGLLLEPFHQKRPMESAVFLPDVDSDQKPTPWGR